MTAAEAAKMFWSLCGEVGSDATSRSEKAESDSHELLSRFGGHPLAIELLCAYLVSSKSSLSETVKKLPAKMRQIRSTDKGRHTHHNLMTLWQVQFEEIRGQPAASLLGIMSLLSPDRIPVGIFDSDITGGILHLVEFSDHEDEYVHPLQL